jgi:hypothetical protein
VGVLVEEETRRREEGAKESEDVAPIRCEMRSAGVEMDSAFFDN